MRSKEYWAKRAAERMIDYQNDAESTARDIAKGYAAAGSYLSEQAAGVVKSFGKAFNLTETEAMRLLKNIPNSNARRAMRKALLEVTDKEQRRQLEAQISSPAYAYRMDRLQALLDDTEKQCRRLYNAQTKAARSYFTKEIDKAYKHTIFDIQKASGVSHAFDIMPQSRINKILQTPWSGEQFSPRVWKSTAALAEGLRRDMLAGIMAGKSENAMTKALMERCSVGAFAARRLIRTETTYIANQAELEGYKQTDVSHYEFSACLDKRTSEICSELDGKTFAVEDAVPGTNLPPMHPFCRSTTIPIMPTEEELDRQIKELSDEIGADVDFDTWCRGLRETEGGKLRYFSSMSAEGGNNWNGANPIKHTDEELAELYEYAESKGIKLYQRKRFDGDIDLLKSEIDMIADLRQEYNISSPLTVGWKPMSSDDFAITSSNHQQIWFNELALRNRAITESNLSIDNFLSTNRAEGIAAHEMGHIVSGTLKKGTTGLDIFIETVYNVDGNKLPSEEAIWFLKNTISDYAANSIPTMQGIPKYDEIIPEMLSCYTTKPNKYTSEFVRLLKEACKL